MNPQDIIPAIIRAELHHFRGRLGKDPEIKYLESGKIVTNAFMLVNPVGAKRDDGTPADAFSLQLWGEQAEAFANQFHKGDMVLVVGRVKIDHWSDRQTGEVKMTLVVVCDAFRDGSLEAVTGALGQQQAVAPAPASAAAPVWTYSPELYTPAPAAAPAAGPPAPPAAPAWASDEPPF